MAGARGNTNDVDQAGHPRRRDTVFVRAIAQLAGLTATPGPDRSIRAQRQAVIIARGDLHDPGQTAHGGRSPAAGRAAIAQLAKVVVAP